MVIPSASLRIPQDCRNYTKSRKALVNTLYARVFVRTMDISVIERTYTGVYVLEKYTLPSVSLADL